MTDSLREQVIAMAEQHDCDHDLGGSINAERLALAVAALAVEHEREACARLADEWSALQIVPLPGALAAAIRARGDTL